MLPRSKTLVLIICLFMIAFKVAASGAFVQTALERVQQFSKYGGDYASQQLTESHQSTDEKHHQTGSLNLMSHVTANLSFADYSVLTATQSPSNFGLVNDPLLSQIFPDCAFKPPKDNA